MANSRKTWISIAIASVIVVCLLALAAVGGTVFFIYRHVDTSTTTTMSAQEEFAAARKRFEGQRPLIELRHDDEPVIHKDLLRPARESHKPLQSLRVLAFDEDEGK